MSKLFLKKEKNEEFFHICEKIRSEAKEYISTRDIAVRAEATECSSFFTSVAYIKWLILQMNTDRYVPSSIPHIAEKHNEIYNRYKTSLSENNGKSISWHAKEIFKQGAPRFYLSEDYATILYYKLMNKSITY